MSEFDISIIGAGPGGTTLATLLAQAGYTVLILEKESFPRYKIGESLLPATVRDLADMLGLDKNILKSEFMTKRGATFSWGKDPKNLWNLNFAGPKSAELILNPDTPASYNVDRAKFDQILVDNSLKYGVKIKQKCQVSSYIERNGRVIGVNYLDQAGEKQQVFSKLVADASGQNSILAKTIGKREFSKFFKKIAVWCYFENGERLAEPFSGNVVFQTHGESWIWYIPIDENTTSVGVVTPCKIKNADQFLKQTIDACPLIKDLLKNASQSKRTPYDETRICSDYSYCYSHFWKPGALTLGDAACFVEVLLSSGVHLATYGALLAAQSINAILSEQLSEEAALNEYEVRLRKEYAIFYDGLIGLYDMQRNEQEYTYWLRDLLIGTSGIAFEPEKLVSQLKTDCNEQQLLLNGRYNLKKMKSYNKQQLNYDQEAGMFKHELPKLQSTLIPDEQMRNWLKIV